MPFLRIGRVVLEVTDDVLERWPALEAEALAAAAARPHGRPAIMYRSAGRGFGSLSLRPEHPAVPDPGPANHPSTIVEAATTWGGLSPHDPPPEDDSTDEEIAELVREMKADRPDLDWDNTLSGRLLGPATPDRPDIPVWEYAEVADHDPTVRLEDLTALRFPVRFPDGTVSVGSVDEEIRPLPSHLKRPPVPILRWDARAVISRYAALHDAGLLEWDPVERGIVRLGSLDDHRIALESWVASLREDGSAAHP